MVSLLIQVALRAAGALVEAFGSASDLIRGARTGVTAHTGPVRIARVELDEGCAGPRPDRGPGPVLVIDATSPLGRECLAHLVRAGWRVIAGVRSLADAATLTAAHGPDLHPVGLDLDDPRSVELTLEEVARVAGDRPLAIVHVSAPVPLAPLECVFPVPPGGGFGGCAQGALARLLDRADRLVIVASSGARRPLRADLAGALDLLGARRAAAGTGEGTGAVAVTWSSCAGGRQPSTTIGERLEEALRDSPKAHIAWSGD